MSECEDTQLFFIPIPGPIGPTGQQGLTGSTGNTGPAATTLLFRAEHTVGNIVVVDNIVTDVTFEVTNINTGYIFDGTTLTIPIHGYYNITAQIMMAQPLNYNGRREVLINANNVIYHGSYILLEGDQFITPSCSIMIELNAGDQVKIQAFQDAGVLSSVQIVPNNNIDKYTWFSVELLQVL